MNTTHKLSSLRRPDRQGAGRRRAGPLAVLLLFLVGFAALCFLIFGDRMRPRVPVAVHPVILLESGEETTAASPGAGTMIAQASGWIEPDPYPVRVPVKADGFVETVHVLEGESIQEGDLIATMDATNAMLRVDRLIAEQREAEAALAAQQEIIRRAEAETQRAEAALRAAEARRDEAADRVQRIQSLPDEDVSPVERIEAERAGTERYAAVTIAEAERDAAHIRVDAARRTADQLRTRIEQRKAVREQAELDLARTKVFSPMDGVVMERYAAPGMKRMMKMDHPESATIVTLYDPARLQVRVDVPLADIGRINTGMTARIVISAFPNRAFTGVVTRITGEADITRNTLQVKVSIRHPHPRMRPEMLCRAEFLETVDTDTNEGTRGAYMLWIPANAIVSEENGSATVWVVDPVEETAHRRTIQPGTAQQNGLRSVREGLRAGERVVTQGTDRLKTGARVTYRKGNNDE